MHNYHFVLYFEMISFIMVKYIVLINSFLYMNELFVVA